MPQHKVAAGSVLHQLFETSTGGRRALNLGEIPNYLILDHVSSPWVYLNIFVLYFIRHVEQASISLLTPIILEILLNPVGYTFTFQ